MNTRAIELVQKCYENKHPELDLGCCRLRDSDFKNGSILSKLISKCTHLETMILSDNWWDSGALEWIESKNKEFTIENKNDINSEYFNEEGTEEEEEEDFANETYFDNYLTCIPAVISRLAHLKLLAIGGGSKHNWGITEISILENLVNLEILQLCSNQIRSLKGLEKLHSLVQLDLYSNNLTSVAELENLNNLIFLDISHNKITHLNDVWTLHKMKVLLAQNNEISNINGIENLKYLETLDINKNKLEVIKGLEHLKYLKYINLSDNNINSLKSFLPIIKRGLRVLWNKPINLLDSGIILSSNPIEVPTISIIKQGNEAIINYFEEVERKGSKALNECKLIFIGDGGAGKTSLMRHLVYDEFDQKEITTHGINKIAWHEIKNETNEIIRINLWDFGGQHIQHSLHQFFFTERVIYVLVLNPRNDEKSAYWLEQVRKLGDGSKVLLVYNWKQIEDKAASFLGNFYELRKKYPEIIGPYLISCKEKGSESEFKKDLINIIKSHEELNDLYPITWYNIKKTVEDKVTVGENYVDYKQYKRWCDENDYKDESKQKSLLSTLNRIGSIVFFDRQVLDRLPVFNPEWITTGAYAILTAEITNTKNGKITYQDLKKIFQEPKEIFSDKAVQIKYDEEQYGFIIQLMLQYDLCQENPHKIKQYLIPSSFKGKPETDHSLHKQNAQVYRVQFDAPFEMLIIQRLIARKIIDAVNEDYWQSGIFIKDPLSDTFALIETNLHSNRIDFWIKGQNVRGQWESIRRDLHEVLSMYKKIDYKEEVKYTSQNKEVFLPYQEMLVTYHKGIFNIPYHPTYDISNIDVLEVLDMFEDASKHKQKSIIQDRKSNRTTQTEVKPHNIFCSYSKDNLDILYQLQPHFANLKRQKKVIIWTDGLIEPGKPWNDTIKAQLEIADTVLCLISPGFLANDYIMDIEIPKVTRRLGGDHIIPVFTSTTEFKGSGFDTFQGLLNIKQFPQPLRPTHCHNGIYWLKNIPAEERDPYFAAIVEELIKKYKW